MRRRIAFIDYFPTHYRRRLYEELAERMEVDFYFFADERERYWNRKIPLVREGEFRRVDLRRFRVGGNSVMPGVVPRLRPSRYDAVVKSLNGKLMLPLTFGAAKTTGLPFVLWTGMWYHPRTPVHRATRPLTEAVYRNADAIVTYGDHVRRFVLESDGVDPGKVFVAGQAVDATRFTPVQPVANGHAEVLFVGQFEERKGLRVLFDAFSRIEDRDARLRLVGNGSQEDLVRDWAGRDPRIELVGHVSQDDLPAELARARCLVLPSITTDLDREPWGLVVNEAMHAGVPVVASDAVGAAVGGLVDDGRNGLVVPEGDAAALRDAMRRLMEDPELARRFGDRARAAAGEFDYRRMADGFQGAVEHAIAARQARLSR
jgi:glycosyltransferase involved in cell wall biosynthesis